MLLPFVGVWEETPILDRHSTATTTITTLVKEKQPFLLRERCIRNQNLHLRLTLHLAAYWDNRFAYSYLLLQTVNEIHLSYPPASWVPTTQRP